MSSGSLTRRNASRAREELRGLTSFNGVLVKMSDEEEALSFFHANPIPMRDFLAALGLEYNPGAKNIQDIVKHTELLEAWATVYGFMHRNPVVVKKMVANLRRKYGARFAELPPSTPLELQAGGGRIINFLGFLMAMLAFLYSGLSAHEVYERGSSNRLSMGGMIGAAVVGGIGDALKAVPGVSAIAGAFGKVADWTKTFTNIPIVFEESLVARPTNRHPVHRRLNNMEGRKRENRDAAAAFSRYAREFGPIEISYAVQDGEGLRRVTIHPFEEIAAEPQKISARIAELEDAAVTIDKEIERLNKEAERALNAYAEIEARRGSVNMLGFSTAPPEEHIQKAKQEANTKRNALSAKQANAAEKAAELARLRRVQQQARNFPASLPFIGLIQPASVGEAIADAMGRKLAGIAADIAELPTEVTSISHREAQMVKSAIDRVVREVEDLPILSAQPAEYKKAVTRYVSDSLMGELHRKFHNNIVSQQADLRAEAVSIEIGNDLFTDLAFFEAVQAEADRRGVKLTEDAQKQLNEMLDDFRRFDLQPKDMKKAAVDFVNVVSTGDSIACIQQGNMQEIIGKVHIAPRDRIRNAIWEFILTGMSAGVPMAVLFFFINKAATMTPAGGPVDIAGVLANVRREAIRNLRDEARYALANARAAAPGALVPYAQPQAGPMNPEAMAQFAAFLAAMHAMRGPAGVPLPIQGPPQAAAAAIQGVPMGAAAAFEGAPVRALGNGPAGGGGTRKARRVRRKTQRRRH
jgi:hypothetical protein